MTERTSKKDRHFERVERYKERYRQWDSEKLRTLATKGPLIKEAAIALQEVLQERDGESSS